MKSWDVSGFRGLDLRHTAEGTDPRDWREARNVHVAPGGSVEAREQLKLYAKVDSRTRGLYVVNDLLRTALPYPELGVDTVPRPPVDLIYDLLSDQTGADMTYPVLAVSGVAAWDNRPYLCMKMDTPSGVRYRHYFIPDSQSIYANAISAQVGDDVTLPGLPIEVQAGATVWLFGISTVYRVTARVGDTVTLTPPLPVLVLPKAASVWWPVQNRVRLPFEPGPPVITASRKIFAADSVGRNFWFSSTQFGPTDWEALGDAGFQASSQHVDGDQPLQGFGIFNSQLVVFYKTVAQVWRIDPDPDNMALVGNVGGAGTVFPGSVENVSGDLYYFASGAFRSFSAVITTGQGKEADIGAKIRALTQALTPTAVSAVWSSWRQQYLCVMDAQVFVFTASPDSGTYGWGRWEFPWPVSDLVEWRNRIYVRRADADEIWVLDASASAEPVFTWSCKFGFTDCETSNHLKQFRLLDLVQVADPDTPVTLSLGLDPSDATDVVEVGDFGGTTTGMGKIPINALAEHLQVQFAGVGPWKLDLITLRFETGNLL